MRVEGNVRSPAVAGSFYPADPLVLRRTVESLLAQAPAAVGSGPKALIAPHAGYLYSGPVAATAYAAWRAEREVIHRVVLLGPAHFVPVFGLAVPRADWFLTPLGLVKVDQESLIRLEGLPQVHVNDAPHKSEHSLEVQLPFLQVVLGDFRIVPVLVGEVAPRQVAEVLDLLWGGPETRIVVSSDLSHYLDWDSARRLDQRTATAVEQLQPENIGSTQACGRIPILGLLEVCRRHGLWPATLDLRNSGDTAGDRNRVVGYGAFAFPAAGHRPLHRAAAGHLAQVESTG